VLSGVVTKLKPDEVVVTSSATARIFQYWHLEPLVRLHERVRAERTVLGTVRLGRGHVHLTEIDGGVVENPLQPGHLTPYRDATPPSVRELYFRGPGGRTLNPEALTGQVDVVAAAVDTPPLPLPAPWANIPLTPARISWQLQSLSGQALAPEQTSTDFSFTIPPSDAFSSVYAEGTYQNFPVVGERYFYGTPGDYLFKLNPAPLDTTLMPPGRYRLTVVAADTCGNEGTLSEQIHVLPQPEPNLTVLTGAILQTLPSRDRSLRTQRRFWAVVIATLPTAGGHTRAEALLQQIGETRLRPAGLFAISTGRRSRSPDDVVFTGFYPSWADAYAAAPTAKTLFPAAQPREIVQQQGPRRTPSDSRGRYVVILASLPVRDRAPARALRLLAFRNGLPSVRMIVSSQFKTLEPGYIAVVSGRYETSGAALYAARLDARIYRSAYVRALIARTATPRGQYRRNH